MLTISNNFPGLSCSILLYLGLYQSILDYLGLSRCISVHLGLSRSSQTISVYISVSRTIWDYLGLSGSIWDYLGLYGTIWNYLSLWLSLWLLHLAVLEELSHLKIKKIKQLLCDHKTMNFYFLSDLTSNGGTIIQIASFLIPGNIHSSENVSTIELKTLLIVVDSHFPF